MSFKPCKHVVESRLLSILDLRFFVITEDCKAYMTFVNTDSSGGTSSIWLTVRNIRIDLYFMFNTFGL
jgi:hypothetical protein